MAICQNISCARSVSDAKGHTSRFLLLGGQQEKLGRKELKQAAKRNRPPAASSYSPISWYGQCI